MNILPLTANFEDILGIGIAALALVIPIVAILAHHQQKMAEIIRETNSPNANVSAEEIAMLRTELGQMRQQMNQMAIALDDVRTASQKTEVRERIGEVRS